MTEMGFPVACVLGLAGLWLLATSSDLPNRVKAVAMKLLLRVNVQRAQEIEITDGGNRNG